MNRILVGLLCTVAFVASGAHAATPCSCKDLPVMVQELTEQQFLQQLFAKWEGYTPRAVETPAQLIELATQQFNDAFYGDKGSAAAGTANGGHAAFGTDLESNTCPIVQYLYDNKGKPLKNRDGTQKTVPIDEKSLKTKECDSLVKYAFAHERSHQATCLNLVKNGTTNLWKSPGFFAGDDAKAYQAGIDVLREDTKTLAGKCGWDNTTQKRLPNLDEAKDLAKRAAKTIPSRKRK
jgi:hypothetical protein